MQIIAKTTFAIRGQDRLLDEAAGHRHCPDTFPDLEGAVAQAGSTNPPKGRVARHRTRVAAGGSKRVEVTVPSGDARLLKAVAGALRAGGKDAERIRDALGPIVSAAKAVTGSELVAFFRRSPLVGADLETERDGSTGRSADLG
ncbi:hypothetical protein ACFOGJ_14195 [Marinibaculum pumilum]|uniref:Uncharacterized protein n=1 Tax=Marinibaculum pumilum TaxID=1766165 RepID=A0ABV7L1W1_9PROT